MQILLVIVPQPVSCASPHRIWRDACTAQSLTRLLFQRQYALDLGLQARIRLHYLLHFRIGGMLGS